ncbi:MAG: amidohydrolase family protein, partial [Planctomycetia bacterium]|nr:amidohydrolase family protein [Planctomycetia bacterium]
LAAEQTGLPILYGMRRPEDWPLEEQLALLRPGDVVTYCFRSTPHCIVQNGRVLPAVRDARARGILFDVGHGRASFDFNVAQAALNDGFEPDTISTDLQASHLGQTPIHDLPLVMSKLRAAGMPDNRVFAAVTSAPAQILRRANEIGSLRPGSCADLTILRLNPNERPLFDSRNHSRSAGGWEATATIRAGHVRDTPPLSKGG